MGLVPYPRGSSGVEETTARMAAIKYVFASQEILGIVDPHKVDWPLGMRAWLKLPSRSLIPKQWAMLASKPFCVLSRERGRASAFQTEIEGLTSAESFLTASFFGRNVIGLIIIVTFGSSLDVVAIQAELPTRKLVPWRALNGLNSLR